MTNQTVEEILQVGVDFVVVDGVGYIVDIVDLGDEEVPFVCHLSYGVHDRHVPRHLEELPFILEIL